MINEIKLENFKCFRKADLKLKTLNLFSGLNGMGKSTIIQSLLLTRQSFQQGYGIEKMCINGDYVSLGTGKDILYEFAGETESLGTETITISIIDNGCESISIIKY